MSSLCYVVNLSSVTLLILGFVFAAEAQNQNLGFGQSLTDAYLKMQSSKRRSSGQAASLDISTLKKQADQGDAKAELILGEDYYNSANGLPQDLTQAATYFRKAAERGNAEAQFYLGIMNLNGQGMPLDSAQAAVWYRKAADQGLPFAQYNLGLFYDLGQGVPQNSSQAASWYRKAADQGLSFAQYNLGLLYAHGEGVPQNSSQAASWYRKAADQGDAEAQYDLGVAYAKGTGIKQDYPEAYFWISLAAKGKVETTHQARFNKARDSTAMRLTAKELSQQQKKTDKWLVAHPM